MLREALQAILSRGGFDVRRRRAYRNAARLMAAKANELGVSTVLDVGANAGQFALALRQAGWSGPIISFEPLSVAHAALSRAASGRWDVAPRMAVGRADGEATINIAGNSESSSLLAVSNRSTGAAPETAFISTETVPVRALDSLLERKWGDRLALKIDTQGFEAEVLAGGAETLKLTQIVTVEVSLVELYRGAPVASAVLKLLEDAGFRCISIVEGFSDPVKNEMLQVDATFVRA